MSRVRLAGLSLILALGALGATTAGRPSGQFLIPRLTGTNTTPAPTGALSVPLTVQEALYSGSTSGVARTSEPVTVGVPLPDDAGSGLTDVSSLIVSGASAGQFRILGRWPSGRIKWVLVDAVVPTLSAGGTSTALTLTTTGGAGNFGGSNLASDLGTTISVDTGAATFLIRKANFNGFHRVIVGGTTVVDVGASTGLVVVGPTAGNTTCGACTTLYTSANDAGSTCSVEENGPVRAVVLCTGDHEDGVGNAYMHFTVRMHFYKGLARVKAQTTLRNADNGASSSFAVAHKGFEAYEWRTTANIAGTRTYQIAKHGGAIASGTLSGSNDAYLYQATSLLMKEADWGGSGTVPYTTDSGYDLQVNGASIATGTSAAAQASGGWADIRDGAGAGLSIGVYQGAAYWPKSLEFASGGSDVRIGIWPRQNSEAYYQAWPQWSTHDLYFNFHAAALAAPADAFLQFQHYLVAHASYTHYNTTQAFAVGTVTYPMVEPTVEQAFYEDLKADATPSMAAFTVWPYLDKGTTDTANWNLPVWRVKDWTAPGGGNQLELHWSYFFNFITRGMTGRYLDSTHFYRFITDAAFPHSDGFTWSTQSGLNEKGFPIRTSANSAEVHDRGVTWIDQNHPHFYGLTDYYFLTGDELAKEAALDGVLDYLITDNTYADTGILSSQRAVANFLTTAARMAQFLNAVGETSASAAVLATATSLYDLEVSSPACPQTSANAGLCTLTLNYPAFHETTTPGVDTLRGVSYMFGYVAEWCDKNNFAGEARARFFTTWQHAQLAQSLMELRELKGSGWTDYVESLDLAYALATSAIQEGYYAAGNNRWDQDGFRPVVLLDFDSATGGGGPGCPPDDDDYEVLARVTEWENFAALYRMTGNTDWAAQFAITTQKELAAAGVFWQEMGSYPLHQLIAALTNPTTTTLQDLTLTNLVDNGGGSYTLSWLVPSGTTAYRVKWSPKLLVDSLAFNAGAYTFGVSPTTSRPWFSATNVTPPAPAGVGTTQSLTVATGTTGLVGANFSVKAYATTTSTTVPTQVVWTKQVNPADTPELMVYTSGQYNPIRGGISWWVNPTGSSDIYGTALHTYYADAADQWVLEGGSSGIGNSCTSYLSASPLPWPPNRHVTGNWLIDRTRNLGVLTDGVCSGVERDDEWRYDLTAETWTEIAGSGTALLPLYGWLVHDTTHDLYITGGMTAGGGGEVWVKCPTVSLSAAQTTAGCVTPGVWARTVTTGTVTQPAGNQYNDGAFTVSFWDTALGKVRLFANGSTNVIGGGRQHWLYDPLTKAWTNDTTNVVGMPTGYGTALSTGYKDTVRISSGAFAGVYIHQKDARTANCTDTAQTYVFNSTTNTYTALSMTGNGPGCATHLAWDETSGKIVSWGGLTGVVEVWHGVLK